MSFISKVSEALTILKTTIDLAEKVKTVLGVTDSADLAAKVATAETIITQAQAVLSVVTEAPV